MEKELTTLMVREIFFYSDYKDSEVKLTFDKFEEAVPLFKVGTFPITYFEDSGKLTVRLNTKGDCVIVRQDYWKIILNVRDTVFKVIVKL